jgi:HD-GYP domain-containing protein (c-di-GMP phosphodiesterase class II)
VTVRQRPLQAQIYAWGVVVFSIIAFGVSASGWPVFTQRSVLLFSLLVLITALAWRYPVEFAPKVKVYVTSVPTFAAVILLPLSMAVAVAALGVGIGELFSRHSLFQSAFNTAVASLNALGAGVVISIFGARSFAGTPKLDTGAALVLAAAVNYLINAVVVETMGGLYQRRSPFPGWWERHRAMLPQRAALYLLGIFAALIGYVEPWALLVVVVPAWVVYRSLRDGVALRAQTREAVEQLADIVDMRDRYTFEHSRRVAELAQALALRLNLGADRAREIFMAARVHDVGKIGIPSTMLSKSSAMEDEEWDEMRSHAQVGAKLISRFPDFSTGREIVLHHHERWDGAGYPSGLKGTAIPLGARVVAVADTFDAMTSCRSYRDAMPLAVVYAELEGCRGTQLDPHIVDAFLSLLRERPEYVNRTESAGAAAGEMLPLAGTTS